MVISTFSLWFTSMCALKCMGFSFDKQVYILDVGLNQHSRKGKGSKNVTLIWTGGHIEKTSSLPAARCEQNFILNGIGKLYFFYNFFLSIRASIPVRTVL